MKRGRVNFCPVKTEVQIKSIDLNINGGLFGTTLDVCVIYTAPHSLEKPPVCITFNERVTIECLDKIKPGDFIIIHSVFPFTRVGCEGENLKFRQDFVLSEDPHSI